MKKFSQFNEALLAESLLNRPLVVVDVQPAYASAFRFQEELAELINKRTGDTLMYINAEDSGFDDSLRDVHDFWYDAGMQEDTIEELEFFDKGYGYLREAIDNDVEDADIIAVIREMYRQKVTDSRELYDGDEERIEDEHGEWATYGISVEWIAMDKLKSMSPFYLCGGGKDECLKEVMLMCNALNIKYRLVDKFIY